jgi:MinD-like ATPase involved in chromosome partitioning or flagellar assembly
VVWGTAGAPGRSTIALHLAEETARAGRRVVLVDGDGWAASLAQLLGLPEGPGVTKAARLAADGWPEPLATCLHATRSGLRVLPGLSRADLWPEVRERAWRAVLDAARTEGDVIVDVAAPIEEDEELSFDRAPYRRNLMTRVALAEADEIIVVGTGDPVGVRRLVFAHRQLVEAFSGAPDRSRVVLNRVPDSTRRRTELGCELQRWAGLQPAALLPFEAAFERAVWEGRPLHDVAPRSAWLRDLRVLSSVRRRP